jgi:hypothetical protein
VLKHMEPRYLRTVTAYAEPNKWDGSDNEKPIQAITLAIDSTLDGQRVHGPISFSVDEKTRKAQKCTFSNPARDESWLAILYHYVSF